MEVTNFCEDQHKADLSFNAIYTLTPLGLPERTPGGSVPER